MFRPRAPPRALEFFFEDQPGGGLGQGLFFASPLGLQLLDRFGLRAQLFALDLRRDRGMGLQAGVSPSAELRRIKPLAPAVVAQFELVQAGGRYHHRELLFAA